MIRRVERVDRVEMLHLHIHKTLTDLFICDYILTDGDDDDVTFQAVAEKVTVTAILTSKLHSYHTCQCREKDNCPHPYKMKMEVIV